MTDEENKQDENIDDEFSRLLYDFINQENEESEEKQEKTPSEGLDSLITETKEDVPSEENKASSERIESLDGFLSVSEETQEPQNKKVSAESLNTLDNFLTVSPTTTEESQDNLTFQPKSENQVENKSEGLDNLVSQTETPQEQPSENGLHPAESELATAFNGFVSGIKILEAKRNLRAPTTDFEPQQLCPNYKPSVGKKMAQYMVDCWGLIYKYDPESLKKLPKDATDEEYLTFAEQLTDEELQFTIYSYIETLYNLENCEVMYSEKLSVAQKNRIKKELYDEYMNLQHKKAVFIEKLKEKGFPIDENKLIGNYFHVAQKDAEGAFKALTQNPAMFAPIDFSKIKPRFFGLIKVSPDDGIKANQKIGKFIKNLKV